GQFVVFDLDILILADLVTFDDIIAGNGLAGHRIDVLQLDPVARFAVEPVEADLFTRGGRRVNGDRGGDEGELEIALPIGSRCHRLYSQTRDSPKSGRKASCLQ